VSSKDSVEGKVSRLLARRLPYFYKPQDGPHGGAVKLDFIGETTNGDFLVIEVKQTNNLNYYNPLAKGAGGISPLQRRALDAAAQGTRACVYVAVWQDPERTLWIFDWKKMSRDLAPWYWGYALDSRVFKSYSDWDTWALEAQWL
jgi:hypothetical protein